MTVAVAAMERSRNPIVVKPVKGQLLRREESYTEAFPESSEDDEQAEDEDDGVLYLKPSLHKASDVYDFNPAALSPAAKPSGNGVSRNVSPALQRNVRAWCEATGLPTTITLRFHDRVFHLHKFPLVSRSGYFKKVLKDAKDVAMASDLPGGPDILELAINFCYGSTILMEPANVAEIFCAAEYLQMSEDFGRANLCERSELYLSQVALQSWDDALIVLLHCENLAPHAEHLGIVRRCLDAMAFMACVQIVDPVVRRGAPNDAAAELQCWDGRGTGYHMWWIQDLVALPPELLVKAVLALRREGMQENYVGQVITAFADRWIFGAGVESVMVQRGGDKCWVVESQANPELAALVECVVRVLPLERHVVPVGFLFALLRRGLSCSALHEDCRIQVETQIALQFEHATLHDLLLPSKKTKELNDGCGSAFRDELDCMERILKLFLTRFRGFDDTRIADMPMLSGVAKLWDEYLAEIAFDSSVITPARFTDLVERIPAYMRVVHDHVYRAIHAFLKAHPSTSQEERSLLCRSLNCQKLSQEACAHAVQNDLMPLRLVVQAMFMQQLQTRSVLASHIESASQSFREHPGAGIHLSRSLVPESSTFYYPGSVGNSSRRHPCDHFQESFRSVGSSFQDHNDLCIDDLMYAASQTKSEVKVGAIAPPRVKLDCAVTESRLRTLEAELSQMRKALAHNLNADHLSASTSAYQPESTPAKKQSSHSNRPVEEVGSDMASCGPGGGGCLAQLQPMNMRSGGLLAKALHKLRLRSFGRSKAPAAKKQPADREPVISAPIVVSAPERATFPAARFIPSRWEPPEVGRRVTVRTDSMPRPVSSRVKPSHHVRHKSIS